MRIQNHTQTHRLTITDRVNNDIRRHSITEAAAIPPTVAASLLFIMIEAFENLRDVLIIVIREEGGAVAVGRVSVPCLLQRRGVHDVSIDSRVR